MWTANGSSATGRWARVAKFDDFWIEDNFAVDASKAGSLTQDHGTNPFPTSAGLGR